MGYEQVYWKDMSLQAKDNLRQDYHFPAFDYRYFKKGKYLVFYRKGGGPDYFLEEQDVYDFLGYDGLDMFNQE